MIIDPSNTPTAEVYQLLLSTVLPRPIAWVTTLSPAGVVNAAPFSFFQIVGSRPPMVSICIGARRRGDRVEDKDTLRNIEATGELVVNIVSEDRLALVNATSADYPPDISEVGEHALTPLPSDLVAPPRLAESPVHFECKRERVIRLGREPQTSMVIAEVVRFHIADELWDAEARAVDPRKLRPLARLGGIKFATLGDIRALPRPTWPPK